jgi:two-component system chemotaxis response regulator CheB
MSLSAHKPSGPPPSGDKSIRVAVVDDSAVVRGLVSRWVEEDPGLHVVGRYANGKLAVEQVAGSQPDVIILDIEMPVMDGMTALPELLKARPGVKIIMASTLTKRNADVSIRALSMGATDYIPKPEGNRGVTSSKDFRLDLIKKIKAIASKPARQPSTLRAQPAVAPQERAPAAGTKISAAYSLRKFSNVQPRILTIGCSTGGPQALMQVLGDIKNSISRVPLIITQHMPATFTAILAEHLERSSGCQAKEGESGEVPLPGKIYVAPGGQHMILERSGAGVRIKIYDGAEVNFCKPAVDPLFESVASTYGAAALALVLTGMGHDGETGSLAIADAGGSVIAQDEETSVVWGMPGAATMAGACAAVLPLKKIGPKVTSILQGGRA